MESGLKDKVVLITGAGSGIGRAAALAFADEGSNLALLDLDLSSLESLEREVKHKGVKIGLAGADLSSEAGVNSGIDEALKPFGEKVDVLVNNVGAGSVRRFDEITDEEWKKTFDLNFLSAVRATRKILPLMRKNRSGVIVNNASDLGRQPFKRWKSAKGRTWESCGNPPEASPAQRTDSRNRRGRPQRNIIGA